MMIEEIERICPVPEPNGPIAADVKQRTKGLIAGLDGCSPGIG